MVQESARVDPEGIIIAGSGSSERTFSTRRSALEKSPIIKSWIEDPGSIPDSIRSNGALRFVRVDPKVMETLITYLERDESEQWSFDRTGQGTETSKAAIDHIFYTRVYKLALSLAVEGLYTAALHRIQAEKPTTEVFSAIILEAEGGKLIDDKPFRDWIVGYVAQNHEQLSESKILRGVVEEGGTKAWAICSVLMKGLKELGKDSVEGASDRTRSDNRNREPLTPASSSRRSSSSTHTRNGTPYSAVYNRSPTSSKSTPQAGENESPVQEKKRKLHATVEDATLSEGEDKPKTALSATKAPLKKVRS